MDATGVNEGAKAAIGTLKESISIGKEGGKLVEGTINWRERLCQAARVTSDLQC